MTYLSRARKRGEHHGVLWVDVLDGAGDVLPEGRPEEGIVHRLAHLLVLEAVVDLLAVRRLIRRQAVNAVVDSVLATSSSSTVDQIIVDHQGIVVVVVQSVVVVTGIFGGGAGRVLIGV